MNLKKAGVKSKSALKMGGRKMKRMVGKMSRVAKKPMGLSDYDDWTLQDLMKEARKRNVQGRSLMGKRELSRALKRY